MKNRPFAARAAVSVLFAIGMAGCALGSEEQEPRQEQTGAASEALAKTGVVGTTPPVKVSPPPAPTPVAFPPESPIYCPSLEPACSVNPVTYVSSFDADLRALGCSHAQHWFTGYSSGLLGGVFTLCPDNAAVHAKYGTGLGSNPVSCSACVPEAPVGETYILLEGFLGPNCESGCLTHPYKPVTGVPSDGTNE